MTPSFSPLYPSLAVFYFAGWLSSCGGIVECTSSILTFLEPQLSLERERGGVETKRCLRGVIASTSLACLGPACNSKGPCKSQRGSLQQACNRQIGETHSAPAGQPPPLPKSICSARRSRARTRALQSISQPTGPPLHLHKASSRKWPIKKRASLRSDESAVKAPLSTLVLPRLCGVLGPGCVSPKAAGLRRYLTCV